MDYRYFEINRNRHNVRCKLYSEGGRPLQRLVIFGHGFAGHKDNRSAEKFAGRVVPKIPGTGVLVFNWPSHGDDVKKKIVLSDCGEYLSLVLDYARETLGVQELYAYATSFGGYLMLKYIREVENPFRKIALRSPAVNMSEVLTNTIMKGDEYRNILRGKTVSVGFDRKIQVDSAFLRDLQAADIQKLDYLEFAEDILILHGTDDEVVPFEASSRFADQNAIPFIPVPGADHRFQKPSDMEKATKAVMELFWPEGV